MANLKISDMTEVTSPSGDEFVECIIPPYTPGSNRKIKTQTIADLGAAELNLKSDALVSLVALGASPTLTSTELALINAGDSVIFTGTGTLTIPLNASVAFPIGTVFGVRGFTDVAITATGTLTGDAGNLLVGDGTAYAEKTATNTWVLHNGVETAIADVTGLQAALDAKLAHTNGAGVLTDASSIALTAAKHTLATSSATRTFTISYAGDDITVEVTLSNTAATYTFPSGTLCVSEGVASGNNTMDLAGVSGDKYIIAVKKIGSSYYAVCKNFGQ